jgi:site-specific DNA recombinase
MLKENRAITVNDHPYKDRMGLAYTRVSSKKQETEGSGLQSQETRCINELAALSVPYKLTFKDSFTGGGDFMKRPAMRELLAYIDSNPHQKFVVVFDDLKRFARDVEFHIKLRAAFRARDVVLKCLNYNFDESPEGRFAELIMAGQGQLEREQNRRQVIQKMKARMENGYWPFSQKKGYDIVKEPLHGKIAKPNKIGLKLLKPALEAFARGEFANRADFCKSLVQKGFWRSVRNPEKYIDDVTTILSDCFYMGDIEYKPWGVSRRRGRHQGIISAATFEKIQNRLKRPSATGRIRKDITDDFPVRGLVNCICGAHLTAAWSKGRSAKYGLYSCTGYGCPFYKKSIRKKLVEDGFIKILKNAALRAEVGKVIETVFDKVWKEEIGNLEKEEGAMIRQIRGLDDKVHELTDLARKAKNDQLRAVYEQQIEEAALELEQARGSRMTSETDLGVPYRTALNKATALLKNPYSAWQKMEIEEQHDLFYFVFDEKLTYDKQNGYRTANVPIAAMLFEDFVLPKSPLVGSEGFEPP